MVQQTPAQTRVPTPAAERRAGGGKLTNADYMRLTPPVPGGVRYQLIDGELIEMAGASDSHQVFALRCGSALLIQTDDLGIGEVRIAPYDVHIDEFNTYQPDLLFVSNGRRHIFDRNGQGIAGAPDVVVEILSDSTRRRDLRAKLPVYLRAGVREVVIVDLEARTVPVYAGYDYGDGNVDGDGDGDGARVAGRPARVYGAGDTLTLAAMLGVSVELAPIFARALGAP